MVKNEYYKVVLTARSKSLGKLKEKYVENDRLMLLPLDLTDLNQINQVVSTVLKNWGSIDVLINNAGISFRTVTEHMDAESERLQMQTNYLGPMAIIRATIPAMRESGRGKIINVSSVSGILGMPTMGSYSASKHALEGASESLWFEMKPLGISVSVLRPGFINSSGHQHVVVARKAQIAEKYKGPYADFYSFMRPFVSMLMNFSPATSESLAKEILKIIKTQNPPLWVNGTLDAKILFFLKKFMPVVFFYNMMNWFLQSGSGWAKANTNADSRRPQSFE